VYSESPPSFTARDWNTPLPDLWNALEMPGEPLILGDFNLHHPLWGGDRVQRAHIGAEPLCDRILSQQLYLLLPPGTITREKGNQQSTLDLALCTSRLASEILNCEVIEDFTGSDHLPIETTVAIDRSVRIPPAPRRCWKETDKETTAGKAEQLQPPIGSPTPDYIDSYVDYLVMFIQELIDSTVPTTTPSSRANPWWTASVAQAVYNTRLARRRWRRYETEAAWEDFKAAQRAKQRTIANAKQAYWRTSLHDASYYYYYY
jgi:hypothetical protein